MFVKNIVIKVILTKAKFSLLAAGLVLVNNAQAESLYEIIDLGTLFGGATYTQALDINSTGQVTGFSYQYGSGLNHAFVTNSENQMIDLGTLGGDSSHGYVINDLGQVSGYSETSNGEEHAFTTDAHGRMIDLGILDLNIDRSLTSGSSTGGGTNASGLSVGQAVVGHYDSCLNGGNPRYCGDREIIHAVITENGVMTDLNSLLISSATGWELFDAIGINDIGQIAGTGNHNGIVRAFLMTPVSIPAAVWLMGSSIFGFLGFNSRRCSKAPWGRRNN